MRSRFCGVFLAVGMLTVVFAGCHGGGTAGIEPSVGQPGQSGQAASMTALPPPMAAGKAAANSPGAVRPAPMVKTVQLPPSAMTSKTPKSPDVAVASSQFTVVPGGGTQIAASAANPGSYCPGLESGFGTIYVISNGTSPDGQGDNYIWEGDGQGNWCNLPGLAKQLAVSSSGVLYALNSAGGIYQWGGSSWTGIAGSASEITVGSDGSLYAVSNAIGSGNEPIYRYLSGTWTFVSGSGVSVVGNLDTNSYTTPGGTVGSGGFFVVTSQGYIYWGAADGSVYTGLPGAVAALTEVPIQSGSGAGAGAGGGLYALSYPASAGGTQLYYYDLNTPGWTAEAGSGVSLAAETISTQPTWVSTLYLIGSSGTIYSSPITPVSSSPHPAAVGDTFRFTGTTTQTVTYAYPTSSPEPGYSQTASVTQNITVTGSPCPSATGNVTFTCSSQADFHVAEVDAYPDQSLYPTTDAWYALSSGQWVSYGSNSSDGAGDTFETSYGGTPYVLDEVPETQGASWSNAGALNYREVDSDNAITEQQVNSDGSYSLTQTTDGGYGLGITTSATGTSKYAGGCIEAVTGICTGAFSPLGAIPNTCKSTTTPSLCGSYYEVWNRDYYGIVVQPPSAGTITVDVQKTPSSTTTPAPTVIATPHAWYTPMPGNLLYSESDSIPQVGATLPTACSVPAAFGSTGNEITQTSEAIDPVLGYVSNETINTWIVPGFGPVCIQLSNVENQYYNWTSDTERPAGTGAGYGTYVFSPLGANTGLTPASVETITETLTLQSASGSDVSQDILRHVGSQVTTTTRAATSSSQVSIPHALTQVEVGYARARFDTMVKHVRVQRLRKFERTMEHLMNAGGHHA